MPSFERESKRIVIAGASSLLGAELKSLLEESKFADWDFRLLDEEEAAGTLTEAGGEPAVIQPVEEGSFERARFVFFTGSGEFTRSNLASATSAGAKVIDLSGWLALESAAVAWFSKLDEKLERKFPQSAPAYEQSSAINFASGLRGELLVIHGSGDDNVHFQGFELLVNKLVSLGKPFDMRVYPGRTHGISEGKGTNLDVYTNILGYFEERLPPGPQAEAKH